MPMTPAYCPQCLTDFRTDPATRTITCGRGCLTFTEEEMAGLSRQQLMKRMLDMMQKGQKQSATVKQMQVAQSLGRQRGTRPNAVVVNDGELISGTVHTVVGQLLNAGVISKDTAQKELMKTMQREGQPRLKREQLRRQMKMEGQKKSTKGKGGAPPNPRTRQ